jgi:RNase H-fold protein (predicted Holliday junction resolvase)
MILKVIKYGVLGTVGLALVGGLLFGGDLVSYISTSAKSMRTAMKDNVPIEFELQRARDSLEQIIPEMQANIRLIASEEVEVADLQTDIRQCDTSLGEERTRVARLRDILGTEQVRYVVGGLEYSRDQVKDELARRFDHFKEAEQVLAGKKRLLETRQRALLAATAVLDRTRSQKVRLEDQIAALESQYRLVKAAAVGSPLQVDNSKLAQTEKLIGEIRKRLDTAERVLAHEARFIQPMQIDTITERELVAQVDDYFHPGEPTTRPAAEAVALH